MKRCRTGWNSKPFYVLVSVISTRREGDSVYCDGVYYNREDAQREMRIQVKETLEKLKSNVGEENIEIAEIHEESAVCADYCDSFEWHIFERCAQRKGCRRQCGQEKRSESGNKKVRWGVHIGEYIRGIIGRRESKEYGR